MSLRPAHSGTHFFTGLILFASIVAFSSHVSFAKDPARHVGTNRSALQFSLELPNGWSEVPGKVMEWGTAEGVSINVRTAIDKSNPEELSKQIRELMPKQIKSWKLNEEKSLKIDNKPAVKFVASFDFDGPKGKLPLSNIQYYIHAKEDKYYIVTFTCATSKFDENKSDFDKIAESIQID